MRVLNEKIREAYWQEGGARGSPLLDRRDALLLLDALLDTLDGVGGFDVDLNLLARQGLHLDLRRKREGALSVLGTGGEAPYSGDAPSSWQIGFRVVAVEAECIGEGARVCGRRLRVRWLVFVLSARRCVKLQILGSLCRKKNPRPRLHRQFWKTRWPALLRHSQEPPSPPDSRRG